MKTLPLEGRIDIRLHPQRPDGCRVVIESSRPLQVAGLMVGKTPAEALRLVPLLFAVCGVAQARAALRALQSSLAIDPDAAAETARELLLQAETAREHLLRIFVDWPGLFAPGAETPDLPVAMDQVGALKQALFADGDAFALDSRLRVDADAVGRQIDSLQQTLERRVFGMPLGRWLAIDARAALDDWARRADTLAARSLDTISRRQWAPLATAGCAHLPRLDSGELRRRLDGDAADEFVARPDWRGSPHETTPLSRQRGQPLLRALDEVFGNALITRWVARLVELADIPRRMRALLERLRRGAGDAECRTEAGQGIAQVEAVRGRLVHRVDIDGERIGRYQILAPTEWNFHPRGLVAQSLDGLAARGGVDLERLARIVVNAIDPCVGYRLAIERG